MKDRIYYYIHDGRQRFDGNDCAWLIDSNSSTYDLDKASVFSSDETFALLNKYDRLKAYPVHLVDPVAQMHVPLSKIKRHKPKEIGEKCFLVCTRDTCGKNAAFWRWNHRGYTCDVRASQIFIYDPSNPESNRDIDQLVPISIVKKKMEKRVDFQDLRLDEMKKYPHTLDAEFFKEI